MTYPFSELGGLFYIAEDQDFFKKQGLEVKLTPYPGGGADVFDALRQGGADIIFGADFRFVTSSLANNNIRLLGSIASAKDRIYIAARQDRGIRAVADLKGRKIAVVPASSYEYFLSEFLSRHGLSIFDVDLVYKDPLGAQAAFLSGEVDAVIHSEPYLRVIRKEIGKKAVYLPAQYQNLFWVIAAEKEFLEERPLDIKKFMAALLEAEKFYLNFPEKARRIIDKKAGVDPDLSDYSKIRHELAFDLSMIDALEKEMYWWVAYKLFDKLQTPAISQFLYPEALKKIKPEAKIF